MSKPSKPTELAKAIGISLSYACEILKGRSPPRSLAIHILRRTGWRHDCIASLTDEQIATLEQIEPWIAPSERAA